MRFFDFVKRNLFAACIVALVVVVAGFALFAPIIVYGVRIAKNVPVIVIDAGHGGADAGVVGKTSGAKESELNLDIALMLGEMLEGAGMTVVYTRKNDAMLREVKSDTKKRSDMFSRAKIINSAKADIVVSVHINYFPSEVRRGAQVFFERKSEQSFALAKCVQEALNELNLKETNREYSPLTAEKYILTCSPAASIIVECGFLSNPADEKLLISSAYRAELAQIIAQGIVEYVSSNN